MIQFFIDVFKLFGYIISTTLVMHCLFWGIIGVNLIPIYFLILFWLW